MPLKVTIKAFSAAGRRKRLPAKSIADFEASEVRYGGYADFTLKTSVGPKDLPLLVATDIVELWVSGTLRYRGEVTGRGRSPEEPPKLILTGYGRMLRAGAHVAHQRYTYPSPTDTGQVIRDVVRDWVQPFEAKPLTVRCLDVGQTIGQVDAYIKMTKDVFGDLTKLSGNSAIWGVDVVNDPSDFDYLTDRFYTEPIHTSVDWVLPTPSKRVGNTEAEEQSDKVVNTVFIVGGRPKYPNLMYNGGFERPTFAGDSSAGNLLNSAGFEDRSNWALSGGADYKSTGNNEGAAYEGSQMIQADSVGESFDQTRDNLAQIVPGHDYEFGGHFRRQHGSNQCAGAITISWKDAAHNVISTSVMPETYLAPPDADWNYYYMTARAPAGAAGFDFKFSVTQIGDGSSGQGRGFVCDAMRFFDASIARQDHWQLDVFGDAQITAQNWLYPDFYDDGNGNSIGGRSVMIAQVSHDQNGHDIHLSQGGSRMDVTGNQGVMFQVFAKLPPGQATNARFLLEMHTYRQDGSECGNPLKEAIPAGAMNAPGWYIWNASFDCAPDAARLECYLTFRGSGALIVDGVCVRDRAAYDGAHPANFYIPDGPLQVRLRAEGLLAGQPAYAAQAASESVYGVRSEILTEDALTSVEDARRYAAAYFIANAIPPNSPAVELHEDARIFRCGQLVRLAGITGPLVTITGPLVTTVPLAIVKITHRYGGLYTCLLQLGRELPDDGEVILDEIRKRLAKQDPTGGGSSFTGSSQGTSAGGAGGAQTGTGEVVAARFRTAKGITYPQLESRLDAMEMDIAAGGGGVAGASAAPFWHGRGYLNALAGPSVHLDSTYFAGGANFPAGAVQRAFKAAAGTDGSLVWETGLPLAVWMRLGLRNVSGAQIAVNYWLPLVRSGCTLIWNGGAPLIQKATSDGALHDLAGAFNVAAGAQGVLDLLFYNQSQGASFDPAPAAAPAGPAVNSIAIYRTSTVTDPSALSLVGVIPDPGGSWSFADPGPLTPGALYTYAAKRYRASDGSYSALSQFVSEVGPVPQSGAFTLFLSALDQPGITFYDPGA